MVFDQENLRLMFILRLIVDTHRLFIDFKHSILAKLANMCKLTSTDTKLRARMNGDSVVKHALRRNYEGRRGKGSSKLLRKDA